MRVAEFLTRMPSRWTLLVAFALAGALSGCEQGGAGRGGENGGSKGRAEPSPVIEPVRRADVEGDKWTAPAQPSASFSLAGAERVPAPQSPAALRDILAARFDLDLSPDFELPPGLGELSNIQVLPGSAAVTLAASTTVFGTLEADVVVHVADVSVPSFDDPAVEVVERSLVFGIRPIGLNFGHLVSGAPDIDLPHAVLVSAPGLPGAVELSPELIGPEAARFYEPVFGSGDFRFEVSRGNNIAMAVPVSIVPELAANVVGLDRDDVVLAKGRLFGSLAAPGGFHVTSSLPLPRGGLALPDFLPESGVDDLGLELASSFGSLAAKLNVDFHADLDGARRVFSGAIVAPVGRATEGLTLLANMRGQWTNPFGSSLTIRDVGLVAGLGTNIGGSLSGTFAFGENGTAADLDIALDTSGKASFTAFVERIGVAELAEFVNAQVQGVGSIPFPSAVSELRDVELAFAPTEGEFRIGGRAPSAEVTVPFDGSRFNVDLAGYVGYSGDFDVRFEGAVRERWAAPFGVGWLELENIVLELTSGRSNAIGARSEFEVAGKRYGLRLAADGDGASIFASADEISLAELVGLLETAVGENPFFVLGEMGRNIGTLTDLRLELAAGSHTAFSISAATRGRSVFGHAGEFMVSAISESGSTQSVAGVRLDAFDLGRLIGVADSPALRELEFDSAVVVLGTGDSEIDPGRVGPAAEDFYHGLYTETLKVRSGLSLLAALPVDEGSLLEKSLGFVGSDEESLVLGGTVPLRETDPFALEARLPRFTSFPVKDIPTPWFEWGELAFAVEGEGGDLNVGLNGRMQVVVDDEALTFGVKTALSPTALVFAGGLESGGPTGWQPFPNTFPTLTWLRIKGAEVSVEVGPKNSLGFAGTAVIGGKELSVDMTLDPITPAGVPVGFGFEGKSKDALGLDDLVAIQAEMARSVGLEPANLDPLLARIPDLELRPLDAATPLEVTFKASDDPNIALKGALFGAMKRGAPKIMLGSVDADITPLHVDVKGGSPHCIAFKGIEFDPQCSAQTSDVYLNQPEIEVFADPVSLRPEARFALAGELQTPWFATDVNLKYGGKTSVVDLVVKVVAIANAFSAFVRDFAGEPLAAFKSAVEDTAGLFKVSDVAPPSWSSDLFDAIDNVKKASPRSNGRDLLNKALQGMALPAGTSFPVECPLTLRGGIATYRDGVCYSKLPSAGTTVAKVCRDPTARRSGDRCSARQPRIPGLGCSRGWTRDGDQCVRTRAAVCPRVISRPIDGRCYLLTDLPTGGTRANVAPTCPIYAPVAGEGPMSAAQRTTARRVRHHG